MRLFMAVLLSCITGVGGHYVNQRPRKALVFLGIILVWSVGVYIAMTLYASQIVGVDDLQQLEATVKRFWKIPTAGLAVIWLSSILVTYRDAREGGPGEYVVWRASRVVQAMGLSLLAGLVLMYQVWSLSHWVSLPGEMQGSAFPEPDRQAEQLAGTVMLGLGGDAPPPLAAHVELPEGAGLLAGQLLFVGKPFVGLGVQVVLNRGFVTQPVQTDSTGHFEARLPPGAWHVTGLGLTGWPAAIDPAGYVLLAAQASGCEQDGPLLVRVGEVTATNPTVFRVEPAVALVWPRPVQGVMAEGKNESEIGWQPYAGASLYVVTIAGRTGAGERALPVVRRRIADATSLSLSGLSTFVAGEGRSDYLVTVQALAEDGRVLSRSTADWQRQGFFMAGGRRLVGDLEGTGEAPAVNRERIDLLAIERNQQRLQAVVALLRDGMVAEAGLLLEMVQGGSLPGHLEAVRGYFLASNGQCAEADEMFSLAGTLNEGYEIPSFFREGCKEKAETPPPPLEEEK